MKTRLAVIIFAAALLLPIGGAVRTAAARADDRPLTVAVAANALRPIKDIAAAFEHETGTEVRIVSGSTGKLYTQIVQGAPFDIFFAADSVRPRLLEERGFALTGSRFVYVRGGLTVWTAREDLGLNEKGLGALKDKRVLKVAVANPETAPYGAAAIEALKRVGLYGAVSEKLVYGESVAQAMSFATSGNADAAIVARSLAAGADGRSVEVESALYEPIVQEAVIIDGAGEEAKNFADFVKGVTAGDVFKGYGYLLEP